MAVGKGWERDELLVAFRLYCRTPFGRLHRGNPDIIGLAALLGRTPSALAMKACNFASLDPKQRARDVVALGNTSRADRGVWDEFAAAPEPLAAEAEAAFARLTGRGSEADEDGDGDGDHPQPASPAEPPSGPTEVDRLVRARRVQSFFRSAVLVSYGGRCALTGLADAALLTASHIVPWRADERRRADPRNGICLNALLDRAFDRGVFTFDTDLRVVTSSRLAAIDPSVAARLDLADLHGRRLATATRFDPDPEALRFHRETVFRR